MAERALEKTEAQPAPAVEELIVIFMAQLLPSSSYPIRRQLKTLVYQALVD